jgi:hypothetical protein
MYRVLVSTVFIFCLSFTAVLAQSGIQSGKFAVNSSTNGYTLNKNSGDRSVSIEITFPKPCETKPVVVLSVTSVDADKDTNVRYSVEAVSVSRDGFTVKISTWADTKIHGISGQWIAYTE